MNVPQVHLDKLNEVLLPAHYNFMVYTKEGDVEYVTFLPDGKIPLDTFHITKEIREAEGFSYIMLMKFCETLRAHYERTKNK